MTQRKQDIIFQQTEGKLYWYYQAERELEFMRGQEERVSETRIKLIFMRSEYIEACAYQGASAQYGSEHVQGRKSIYSNPIEPAVNAMDGLHDKLKKLWERQMKLVDDITKKEEEMAAIQMAISYLSKLDRDICEYKYRYKMSLEEIARHVNMSKGAIRNRRAKIVGHIADRLETAGD